MTASRTARAIGHVGADHPGRPGQTADEAYETAARQIRAGQSVALDGSSLCLRFAAFLAAVPDLAVTTTSLDVALFLAETTSHTVSLTGGELDRSSRSIVGPTDLALHDFDLGFFGGHSFTQSAGLLDRDFAVATGKRNLAGRCHQTIGFVNSHRVGSFGPYISIPVDALSDMYFISDVSESWVPGQIEMD